MWVAWFLMILFACVVFVVLELRASPLVDEECRVVAGGKTNWFDWLAALLLFAAMFLLLAVTGGGW